MEKSLSIVLPFALLVGCQSADPVEQGDASEETAQAVEDSADAVEAGADIAFLSRFLVLSENLSGMSIEDALAAAIAEIKANLEDGITVPECVTMTTDSTTFIEIGFNQCTGKAGHVTINGLIRAEMGFDTVACGRFECPVAVLYGITTSDLTVNDREISGEWTVRLPFDTTKPSTFAGTLTIEEAGATVVSAESSASWTVADDCVALAFEADVAAQSASLAVTAEDIQICAGQCPSAGTVTIAASSGETLGWTYNGDGTVTLTAPSGTEAVLPLLCTQELP